MYAKTKFIKCVNPKITAIFLSCSIASIVTKLASGNSDRATKSSFFASLTGTEIMFWPLIFFTPGPNIGCMQIGFIFDGIFDSAEIVFDFWDEISIR